MLLEEKIQKFNEEFENKKVLSCYALEIKTLAILSHNNISPCCFSTSGKLPSLYHGDNLFKQLDKDFYIDKYIDFFRDTQNKKNECNNCELLLETEFKMIKYDDFKLGSYNLAVFQGCNVKCVYCSLKNEHEISSADIVSVVKKMIDQNVICSTTEVQLAFGEPTIHKYFDEILNICLNADANTNIYSSGILYSKAVFIALNSDKAKINISVDSGTSEMYKKVKRVDGFGTVWKNIKKYCETNGNVEVKYIVFSYNSSKEELDGFIEKCIEANVKSVIVSPETNSSYKISDDIGWHFGDDEINACAYLLKRCYENNIYAKFMTCYSDQETTNKILLASNYYKNIIQESREAGAKLCIFGFGNLGIEIYKNIFDFTGKKIDFFCDNQKAGMNCEIGIPIISVEDVASMDNIKVIIPHDSRYRNEMINQLESLGIRNYIKI